MAGNRAGSGRDVAVLGVIAALFVALALVVDHIGGRYEADPNYIYLMNGLEMFAGHFPAYYTHPGTPVEILAAVSTASVWLVMLPWHGLNNLVDAVLTRPDFYLHAIGWTEAVLMAVALFSFARSVRLASGKLFPSVVGMLSVFLFAPAFLALHKVAPEPLLLAGGLVLAGLLAPIAYQGFEGSRSLARWIGGVIGFCVAIKATAAPFLLAIILLDGWPLRKQALIAAGVAAIVWTLPVAVHYPDMLSWYGGVLMHQGFYGGGAAGLPGASALVADLRTQLKAMPETFLCLALYAVLLLAFARGRRDDRAWRMLAFCAVFVAVDLLVVLKQPETRYAVPTVPFLCLGNAVAAAMIAARLRLNALTMAAVALAVAVAGVWRESVRADHLGEVTASYEAVLDNAERSGCFLVPIYMVNTDAYNLLFGNDIAEHPFTERLVRLYPDFLAYDNGYAFNDYRDTVTTAEAARRLAGKSCVWLIGSPLERFDRFDLPRSLVAPVARSIGTPQEAVAAYRLLPGWDGPAINK